MPKVDKYKASKKELQPYVQQIIDWVDKGAKKSLEFRQLSPNWLHSAVSSLPKVEILEDHEINGWQGDWWQSFMYKGKQYCMSGSAHYGFAEVYARDDQW